MAGWVIGCDTKLENKARRHERTVIYAHGLRHAILDNGGKLTLFFFHIHIQSVLW